MEQGEIDQKMLSSAWHWLGKNDDDDDDDSDTVTVTDTYWVQDCTVQYYTLHYQSVNTPRFLSQSKLAEVKSKDIIFPRDDAQIPSIW